MTEGVERFSRSSCQDVDVLDVDLFGPILKAQELSDECAPDYNENRPHDGLGGGPHGSGGGRRTRIGPRSSGAQPERGLPPWKAPPPASRQLARVRELPRS